MSRRNSAGRAAHVNMYLECICSCGSFIHNYTAMEDTEPPMGREHTNHAEGAEGEGAEGEGAEGEGEGEGERSAKTPKPMFARVFMTGNSQAVRLPREFRFDVDRVAIRREGNRVILSPPYQDWADYFQNAPRVGDDFRAAMMEMRGNPLPLEDREPLD